MVKIIKVTREMAAGRLADVPADKKFWCNDGRTLKNLAELGIALNGMSEETFRYHSNETKSDFSNWVRDVIGDEKLARDLKKSVNRLEAAKSVTERIAWLKTKL